MANDPSPAPQPTGKPAPPEQPAGAEIPTPNLAAPKPAGGDAETAAGGDAESAAGADTGADAKAAASANTEAAADNTSPTKAATSRARRKAKPVPTPYDPEYERPISELPPLTFPNSQDYDFRLAADQRRRSRIRNEGIFGAVLVLLGLIVLVAAHTPAFLGLAVIAAGAMAAYELVISGLE